MRFGVNSKVNYVGVPKPVHQNDEMQPKKVHQTEALIVQNHDTLSDEMQPKKVHPPKSLDKSRVQNDDTELISVLGLSTLGTLLIAKYIL